MLAQTWLTLFRHIPPEQQSRFTLITINGTEISVQSFLRLESDFAIIKGRLAGSQDAGRVFFIPYASIDTFSFTNPVKDSEVAELFDSWKPPVIEPEVQPPSWHGTENLPLEMIAPAAPVAPSTRTPVPTRLSEQGTLRPLRSEVLERFKSSRPGSSLNLPRPNEG
ncbi:MAG: hypothetical protein SNJ82_01300 [Gemmataceae bacterium]